MISKREYKKYHDNHIKMWNWLNNHPTQQKIKYFIKHKIKDYPCWGCYACQLTMDVPLLSGLKDCEKCPLEFECFTLYDEWEAATTIKERKAYSKQLRDIPWLSYENYKKKIQQLAEVYYGNYTGFYKSDSDYRTRED